MSRQILLSRFSPPPQTRKTNNSMVASFSFQELDYEGAVRFYFEAGRQELTKAVRISNKTKVEDLLPILVEKFNLQKVGCRYTLFVVHEVGECRPFSQPKQGKHFLCPVYFGKLMLLKEYFFVSCIETTG